MDLLLALTLLRKARPELERRFGVLELSLFGSVARGEADDDSDVDVLVKFDGLRSAHGMRLEQEARQQIVLRLAAEGPATNTLVRERLDLARHQAVDPLQSLVDNGQLVRSGEKRGTRYELPSRLD